MLSFFFQSFHFKQDILEIVEREKCYPFGCKTEILKVPVLDENGNRSKINLWVGWENYKNILQFEDLNSIIKKNGYRILNDFESGNISWVEAQSELDDYIDFMSGVTVGPRRRR